MKIEKLHRLLFVIGAFLIGALRHRNKPPVQPGEGNEQSYNEIDELDASRKRETTHQENSINARMSDLTR